MQLKPEQNKADMLAIAFWNVHKNPAASGHIEQLLRNLSAGIALAGHTGDVLFCLAEPANVNSAQIVQNLNGKAGGPWWQDAPTPGRFAVLSNLNRSTVRLEKQVLGCLPVTVKRIAAGHPSDYRIWFVHLTAPMGTGQPLLLTIHSATELRREIQRQEEASAHVRTLAIGDFNMPPYGPPMTAPMGLNAVACVKIAKKVKRTVARVEYPYFFNPMWRLLGCQTVDNQPGSYIFNDSADSTKWHMLDQVILRPCLVKSLTNDSPRILTSTGTHSLLTKSGLINESISDHLPVAVSLKI